MSMLEQWIARSDLLVLGTTGVLALAVLASWPLYKRVRRTRCHSLVGIGRRQEAIPARRIINYDDVEGQVGSGTILDLVEQEPAHPTAPFCRTDDLAVNPLPRDRTPFRVERTVASALRNGDLVLVEAGQRIPADGLIVEGVAAVDESVGSGVSARVLRGEGADCCEVLAGSAILEGRAIVQVQRAVGEVTHWSSWPEAVQCAPVVGD